MATAAEGSLSGSAVMRAILLAVAIVGATALLGHHARPLRFSPISRLLITAIPAFAGASVAVLLALQADNAAALPLAAGTLAAVTVAILIEFGADRLLARRPLRIAVLGAPRFAASLREELRAAGNRDIELVGWLDVSEGSAMAGGSIGRLRSVRATVCEHEVDVLVRGTGSSDGAVSRRTFDAIAEGCLDLPVRVVDGTDFYEDLFKHVPLGAIDSAWFSYLMNPAFEGTSRPSKRCFDLIVGGLGAIVVAPLIAIGALAIKLDDGGPVFFRQRRVGEGGSTFSILKLRTMTENAELQGPQWSRSGDSRVTPTGYWLRRLHLDELPQLFNVLRGEMTLVGPRPERPEIIAELERMLPHYKRRMMVTPGVTGWAQVRCGYAGSALGTAWKLCHDLYYLRHGSMLADILLLIETLAITARDAHRPLRAPQAVFLFDPDQSPELSELHVAPQVSRAVPELLIASRTRESAASAAIAA